ncbi:MAG: hypothetical protein ACW97A_12610 [Candidatus Thorarchaeota archaeon]
MAFAENSQASFMTLGRKVVYSFIGGFVITLITVLLPNTAIIGISSYGYPFPWLGQSFILPEGPMILLWSGLILDLLVWTVVVFVIINLYQVLRKKESAMALAAAKP